MNISNNSIRANPEQLALREDKKSSTPQYEREAASLKVKNMTPIDQFFKPEDIIYTYTSKQAVEDAILLCQHKPALNCHRKQIVVQRIRKVGRHTVTR